MNKRQLVEMGVPEDCVNACINVIRDGMMTKVLTKSQIKKDVPEIVKNPEAFTEHAIWKSFAYLVVQANNEDLSINSNPIPYKQWGHEIDDATRKQLELACELPMAVGAALMPDGHVGYGLPIGGVLATDNYVIPYAVGVDIACRIRITIIDMPPEQLNKNFNVFKSGLEKGTLFGVAKKWKNKKQHDVLDVDWNVTHITKHLKDRAWDQLGTSGSGNHFVEFGTLQVNEPEYAKILGVEPGKYVALLSHSGSRGPGAEVCRYYTSAAQRMLPRKYEEKFKYLAWLSLDTQEGQEYWAAMNLMGQFAAANHEVIHRDVLRLIGGKPLASIENHHNFAWKEMHNGKEVIVHRKGATPADNRVLGIIPGSMADPGFIVRGKGNADSLNSASHGAGRKMSRTKARESFTWNSWKKELEKREVHLISGGLDEVPGAYKSILEVIDAQSDLVDVIARFDPKIVKMCDDGSKPED